MDLFAISGWTMTAIGLAVAAVQTYRVKKLARRNREQLEIFIEDANYVSFDHEIIDRIAPKLDDPMILRFLVSSHQRGCDLYRNLVDFYLSGERRFSYADVHRVCHTRLVSYRWQAEFWRDRAIMRPENKNKEVPTEIFLRENRDTRLLAIKARDAATTLGSGGVERDDTGATRS